MDWNEWRDLKDELSRAYEQEELYWKQKSRNQWLQEGDRNTKFFHASTTQRRGGIKIESLERLQGGLCESEGEMYKEVESYFRDLFTTCNPTNFGEILAGIPCSITKEINSRLVKPVGKEEVRKALFSMNPNKASGPDGTTPYFFSKILAYC